MSGRVITHHLLKSSLVWLGTARLAGNSRRCPNRPVGAMMDLSQPGQPGDDQLAAGERRASPRYPYQRKILCQARSTTLALFNKGGGNKVDNVWLMGASQDLSAAGIGFILHRRFDPGTLLTIELERPQRDSWDPLPGRVMHATLQADGNWKLGCALVNAMSQEELHGWINDQESKVAALG